MKNDGIAPLVLLLVVAVFLADDLIWIWQLRRGGVLDIDEAGYIATALTNYNAFANGGVFDWLKSVEAPSFQAPITATLASLIYMLAGPHPVAGFLVPVMMAVGTIVLSYLTATKLSGRGFGAIVAVSIACCPLIINYSRSFHFAITATCVTTAAVLCMLESQRFRSFRWAIAFGICVGLMPLARTVTLAFYPAIWLAALFFAGSSPLNRRSAFLNLLAAVVVAIATAATWLGWNWSFVADYLLDFGYGNRSTEYGPADRIESARLTIQYVAIYVQGLYVFLIALGVLSFAIAAAIKIRTQSFSGFMASLRLSPVTPIAFFVILSLLALASSSNKGTAFAAPLIPCLLILSLYCIQWTAARAGLWNTARVVVFLACIAAATPLAMLSPPAHFRNIDLPVIRDLPLYSSRAPIENYVLEGSLGNSHLRGALTYQQSKAWVDLSRDTYDLLQNIYKPGTVVKFGFRNYIYNVNTVAVFNGLAATSHIALDQISPTTMAGNAVAYQDWLLGPQSPACILLTSDGDGGEILPVVNTPELENAASAIGYRIIDRLQMPNRRTVLFWQKPC